MADCHSYRRPACVLLASDPGRGSGPEFSELSCPTHPSCHPKLNSVDHFCPCSKTTSNPFWEDASDFTTAPGTEEIQGAYEPRQCPLFPPHFRKSMKPVCLPISPEVWAQSHVHLPTWVHSMYHNEEIQLFMTLGYEELVISSQFLFSSDKPSDRSLPQHMRHKMAQAFHCRGCKHAFPIFCSTAAGYTGR